MNLSVSIIAPAFCGNRRGASRIKGKTSSEVQKTRRLAIQTSQALKNQKAPVSKKIINYSKCEDLLRKVFPKKP